MTETKDTRFQKMITSGGILFLGLAFQLGFGFLSRLLIAREFGSVNYGAISLGITLLMSTSVLVLLGMDTGVGRYLPRYDEPKYRRGVLLSSFQSVLPLAIAVGIALFLLSEPMSTIVFNDRNLTPILQIFSLAIPLAAFVRLTVGSIRGMQESTPRVLIENIALPLIRFGLIVVVLIFGFESVGIAWAYALAYGIVALISLYHLFRNTPLFGRVEAVSMHKTLLVFSFPLLITATMNMVFSNIDTFMLGAFSPSTGDVGIYNAVYPLAQLHIIVLNSFGFIFLPIISELHSNGNIERMKRMYHVVSKWIFIATLPLFLAFVTYPDVIISNTFGSEYLAGGLTLSILSLGFFTHAIAGPSGNVLTAIGKQRFLMYDNVTVAVINVVLNLILIPRYSFVGAAVATTVGYVLMNSLYIGQLYRTTGIHPFRKALLRPGIAAFAIWMGIQLVVRQFIDVDIFALIAIMGIYALLYGIVILRFGGVENEEITILASAENRIGIDLDIVRNVAKRFVQ